MNALPMISVTVEVETPDSTFTVNVRAKNIEHALDTAKAVYSATEAKVVFPIDPDTFFVESEAETDGVAA
jgi:hypothetical protein